MNINRAILCDREDCKNHNGSECVLQVITILSRQCQNWDYDQVKVDKLHPPHIGICPECGENKRLTSKGTCMVCNI